MLCHASNDGERPEKPFSSLRNTGGKGANVGHTSRSFGSAFATTSPPPRRFD